ncbi:MAG: AAA family ATPase [Actinomycetales bacterium]|nr:AAA family ATPase [Actinomycetales bacterium]
MAQDSLFGSREGLARHQPLAARMRPRSVDELVGCAGILAAGAPLRRLLDGQRVPSLVLHGPAGSGKTTIATLVSLAAGHRFVELSAVTAGVKDVREAIAAAQDRLQMQDQRTVLFIDEIHRFSKSQQDALLPAVESGTVTLLAATTENPVFAVIGPLLSRSIVVKLSPLASADLAAVLERALLSPVGLADAHTVSDSARSALLAVSDGDARRLLTVLEAAAGAAQSHNRREVVLADVEAAASRALVRYDRAGDRHYDVAHLFIGAMRASDAGQAMHWLAVMLRGGEDPRFIARRIAIFASEDVGAADPQALLIADAAAGVTERVGLPECAYALAQATLACANAPKSRAVVDALGAAFERVDSGQTEWPTAAD